MDAMEDPSDRSEQVIAITAVRAGDWIGPHCVVRSATHRLGGFGRHEHGSSTFELESGGVLVFPHEFVTHLRLWHRAPDEAAS